MSVESYQHKAARKNLVVALSACHTAQDAEPLAELVKAINESGTEVALVADADNRGRLEVIAAASGGNTHLVRADNGAALRQTLASARGCVVHSAGVAQRPILLAAMLSGTPLLIFHTAQIGALLPPNSPVWSAGVGKGGGEIYGLLESIADETAMLERGSAARMYAMATLAPDSCAAQMLGVYLRAVGDAS
jgi:hypothetical protein